MSAPWIRACGIDDIADGEAFRLDTVPPVSVFRDGEEFFCLDDTCTHEDYSLADSWIEDCTVECPLHQAKFCLRTGAVLAQPATRPLATHDVKVEGTDIYVRIDREREEHMEGAHHGAA